uniref:Uncharacterized protein n=1 Tax=Utricularia reniformis TaxID=192314 RepID=A0A1Y0B2Y9_9LAMI|nr:hypothetical protein AEK19_MT1573 [Utricularia reniformis]ART31758.1 hypothetical protein AEK19_MT1573 [Utricularia reniformis]
MTLFPSLRLLALLKQKHQDLLLTLSIKKEPKDPVLSCMEVMGI